MEFPDSKKRRQTTRSYITNELTFYEAQDNASRHAKPHKCCHDSALWFRTPWQNLGTGLEHPVDKLLQLFLEGLASRAWRSAPPGNYKGIMC